MVVEMNYVDDPNLPQYEDVFFCKYRRRIRYIFGVHGWRTRHY